MPAGVRRLVTFTVPGGEWVIYVNDQALVSDIDLGGRRGDLPVKIQIEPNGQVGQTSR